MKLTRNKDTLTYTWKDVTFKIRARATRGDQYDMHATAAGGMEIEDGRLITTKPGVLFPWVIGRFVEDWTGVVDEEGNPVKWSLENLMALPSEPEEDLILILGSYIFNRVGLVPSKEQEELKKD